jgi:hypothetical protein
MNKEEEIEKCSKILVPRRDNEQYLKKESLGSRWTREGKRSYKMGKHVKREREDAQAHGVGMTGNRT